MERVVDKLQMELESLDEKMKNYSKCKLPQQMSRDDLEIASNDRFS